jgi:hypothetical protein
MPRDDAAAAAATQDVHAVLARELRGSVVDESGDDALGARQLGTRADLTASAAAASTEGLPFGHERFRHARTVVAGPPDDAGEMAQREVFAALFGASTPGAF